MTPATDTATDTKTAEQLINEADSATENSATESNGTNPATDGATANTDSATATIGTTDGKSVNRWSETNHVFATPHPAHELISCQTAYGRDMKDEAGNVIDAKPEGFDRVMLPNLIPSGMLAEAERLCSMHRVDLRDEWRFAQLQLTQALINDLSQRPVPADYKGETRRLSDAEREAKKNAADAKKAETDRLREQGKALREAQKAEMERIQAEYKAKMEAAGIKVPERTGRKPKEKAATETNNTPTLGDAPGAKQFETPTATPVTLVQPSAQAETVTNGTETQEAATERIATETANKAKTAKK